MSVIEGNYMASAFAPALARYQEVVFRDTWGHLAPEAACIYVGEILFANGDYGDIVPIRARFADADKNPLPDSPWFFEGMTEWLSARCERLKSGRVYRFTGTYRQCRNGAHRFSGVVRVVA